ncbi:S24 family peptidase [Aureimonas altamirensis]|uniref:S24 family peptidase n=1 Tax=Aureimonas altamirensis TaxID=370622 RepID=UPI003D1541DA
MVHVEYETRNVFARQHYSCADFDYRVRMSDMHYRLRLARERAGYSSAAKAAKALGMPPSSYTAHENGQNGYKPDKAAIFAKKFGVSASWLLTGDASEPSSPEDAVQPTTRFTNDIAPNASPPVPVTFPGARISILGHAVGGVDGKFVLNGQQVMDTFSPPQLVGVPDAYGVFVHGDSMEPRYYAGEAVFVNPLLPVRSGDFAVVQIAGDFEGDDAAGYVKRFVSMNSREIVLEQFKPREDVDEDAPSADRYTLRFPRNRVIAVHKIIQSGIV